MGRLAPLECAEKARMRQAASALRDTTGANALPSERLFIRRFMRRTRLLPPPPPLSPPAARRLTFARFRPPRRVATASRLTTTLAGTTSR